MSCDARSAVHRNEPMSAPRGDGAERGAMLAGLVPRGFTAGGFFSRGFALAALALGGLLIAPAALEGQQARGWIGSTAQLIEMRPLTRIAEPCPAEGPCYASADKGVSAVASQDLFLTAWGL